MHTPAGARECMRRRRGGATPARGARAVLMGVHVGDSEGIRGGTRARDADGALRGLGAVYAS